MSLPSIIDLKYALYGLLCCVVLQTLPVLAQASDAAQFVFVRGDVAVIHAGIEDKLATKGMALNIEDTIRTGEKSYAQLKFSDGNRLVVRGNTELRLDQYRFDQEQATDNRLELSLAKGSFRSVTGQIGRQQPQNYLVKTVLGVIGVRGTDHEPTFIPTSDKKIAAKPGLYDKVNSGATVLSNDLGSVVIGANQAGFISLHGDMPVVLPNIPQFYNLPVSRHQTEEDPRDTEHKAKPPGSPEVQEQGQNAKGPKQDKGGSEASDKHAPATSHPPKPLEPASDNRPEAPRPPKPPEPVPDNRLPSQSDSPRPPAPPQEQQAVPPPRPAQQQTTDNQGVDTLVAKFTPGMDDMIEPQKVDFSDPLNHTPAGSESWQDETADPLPNPNQPLPNDGTQAPPDITGEINQLFPQAALNPVMLSSFMAAEQAANTALEQALLQADVGAGSLWQNTDMGGAANSGIQWGRWQAAEPDKMLEIHWISAPAATAKPVLPITGIFTYQRTGGTQPTDNAGNIGNLNAAQLQVDFNRATVDASFDLNITNQAMQFNAAGMPIMNGGFQTQQAVPVQCANCSHASAQIQGNFVGVEGKHAISGYHIQNNVQQISGTAAFSRQ